MKCFDHELETVQDPAQPAGDKKCPTRHPMGSVFLIKQFLQLAAILLCFGFVGATVSLPAQEEEPDSPTEKSDDGNTLADPLPEPEEPLPKLSEISLPTLAELLQNPPIDWVVLKTEEVLVVKPVYPRPRTLEVIRQKQAELESRPRASGRGEIEARRAERYRLQYLEIMLPESTEEDPLQFRVGLEHISQVIHHEDLLLRRAGMLMDTGEYRDAFEILFVLKRRHRNWPGIDEAQNRLLVLEAVRKLGSQEPEAGLVYLEKLYQRDSRYPELNRHMGSAADSLIGQAIEDERHVRARHFLRRLSALNPQHAIVEKWRTTFVSRATRQHELATEAMQNGNHSAAVAAIENAALYWPALAGLRDTYRRITNRYQRVNVGVLRLPGETSTYFLPTRNTARAERLTRAALFEINGSGETARYVSRLFEQWEPTDLGRKALFRLRQQHPYWAALPNVSTKAVVETMAARVDPQSPSYDERFASYVDALVVQSPYQFEVRFSRVPVRVQSLFRFPLIDHSITLPPAGEENQHNASERQTSYSGGFRLHEQSDQQAVFRRTTPEPDGVSRYHIAEVVEKKYPSHDRAVQGLQRGEVSLLPHVPAWDVSLLSEDTRFFVLQYALPETHVLQFNGQSKTVADRELRRALTYSLDRERILRETVLRDPAAERGRVVSGPFPKSRLEYNQLVEPREFNLWMARALTLGAEKRAGGKIPTLKMLCVPDPVARAAAEELIRYWARIKIPVELIVDDGTPLSRDSMDWDIVYRTVRMDEPLVQLWPFLAMEPHARIASLTHLPDWLRQELLALDDVGNWNQAIDALRRLHRHLWAESHFVALWEVNDFLVIRKNIRGLPQDFNWTYDGLDSWVQNSRFPSSSQ